MTSSIKSEIHNVSLRHQRRTEPRPNITCAKNGEDRTYRSEDMIADRQTHTDTRDGTGSHFVTQRPSDPGIQRPENPVVPVTLFYNELQMSKKYSKAKKFLIIIGKSKSSLHGLTSSDFSPTTDT